jgi:DNA-binding transcriptional ArsR family regulator
MQDIALDAAADEAAQFLRAMGHPARLRIVCALLDGESAAGPLAELAGLRAPALSQHAAVLESDRLISRRRVGQSIVYRLASPRARQLAQLLNRIYCGPARRRSTRRRAGSQRRK